MLGFYTGSKRPKYQKEKKKGPRRLNKKKLKKTLQQTLNVKFVKNFTHTFFDHPTSFAFVPRGEVWT